MNLGNELPTDPLQPDRPLETSSCTHPLSVQTTLPTSMTISGITPSQLASLCSHFDYPLDEYAICALNEKLAALDADWPNNSLELTSFVRGLQAPGDLVTLQIIGHCIQSGTDGFENQFSWEIEDGVTSPSLLVDFIDGAFAIQLDWNKVAEESGSRQWRDVITILELLDKEELPPVLLCTEDCREFTFTHSPDINIILKSRVNAQQEDLSFPSKSIWVPVGLTCHRPTEGFIKMLCRELDIDIEREAGLGTIMSLVALLGDEESRLKKENVDAFLTRPGNRSFEWRISTRIGDNEQVAVEEDVPILAEEYKREIDGWSFYLSPIASSLGIMSLEFKVTSESRESDGAWSLVRIPHLCLQWGALPDDTDARLLRFKLARVVNSCSDHNVTPDDFVDDDDSNLVHDTKTFDLGYVTIDIERDSVRVGLTK